MQRNRSQSLRKWLQWSVGAFAVFHGVWQSFTTSPEVPTLLQGARTMAEVLPANFSLTNAVIILFGLLLLAWDSAPFQRARRRSATLVHVRRIPWSHGPALLDLKRDASALSQEILRFLGDNRREEDIGELLDDSGDVQAHHARWLRKAQQSMEQTRWLLQSYDERFAARAIGLREKLLERGYGADDADGATAFTYQHPTNPIGIRLVALSLGAMAEKIPGNPRV